MANPYNNVKKSPLNQNKKLKNILSMRGWRQAQMYDTSGEGIYYKKKAIEKGLKYAAAGLAFNFAAPAVVAAPVAAVRYGARAIVPMVGGAVKYAIRNPKKTAAFLGLSGWLGHETDKANKKANDKIKKGTEATTKNPGF